MKLLFGICIVVSLICVGSLLAAEFSPALEYQLTSAKNSDFVSAIVILESPVDIRALDDRLHVEKATKARRHAEVLAALHYNAESAQPKVRAEFDQAIADGVMKGYTPYWIENLFVIQATKDFIEGLRNRGDIKYVTENFQARLIEPIRPTGKTVDHAGRNPLDSRTLAVGIREVGALRVNEELGITGNGVLIGDCDTGTDGTHPALAARWRGNFAPWWQCWKDNINHSSQFPTDQGRHGTHTMGTMTGRGVVGTDTTWVGCAPNAHWISNNAINMSVGAPFNNEVIASYQWFTDPDTVTHSPAAVPDVINNSWGVDQGLGYVQCYDFWNTVILNCEAGGTVVCFAAGNESTSGLRSPAIYSINAVQIFSVGAVDGTTNTNPPYPLASFSSQGPTPCLPAVPNNIKPEISGPGVNVLSSVPGGTYENTWSGTSMATPHISGIVALMREACPNCDPTTIKTTLESTAIRTGYVTPPATENNQFGNGFIDGYAAVQAVSSLGRIDGYVTLQNGTPIPGVRVQAIGMSAYTQTDTTGYYNLNAQAGMYNVRYTKFGFQSVQRDSITTVEGDTTHVSVIMSTAAAGVLAGTVVLQSGVPVQGAQVNFPGTPVDTLITDVNGHFVHALPATSYSVHIHFTINIHPPRQVNADTIVVVNAGDTTHATLTVTVNLVEPSPADAYGYRAYDRYDRDLPCPYDWVELDPGLGGNGVEFTYVHHDSADFFPAPFPLTFYGHTDTLLTVNCNGWMLPGEHHEAAAVDHVIPSHVAGDPPGIIAPLWNDWRRGNGAQQFSYHDAATGRWIFEFVNQRLVAPANFIDSWQVQLIDPAYVPTATGDFEVHFLYDTLGYPSTSTVGIENATGSTGVQVQHDTSLASWAWPVEKGAAIRFTTGRAIGTGTATVNLSLYPPLNQGATVAVRIAGQHVVQTLGSTPTMTIPNVAAAPISAILDIANYEKNRVDHVVIAPNGNTPVPMTAWRLDPPQQVSGTQMNGVVTLRWHTPQSVQFHAYPVALRYNVYRDGNPLAALLTDSVFTDQTLPNDSTVSYVVEAVYRHDVIAAAPYIVTIDLAARNLESTLPTVYQLYPNYPNPFNPDTRIRLDIPATSNGRLEIYDLQGRLVRSLWSGTLSAGRYQYSWNSRDEHGRSVSSGLYFCRFASPSYTATQKMMLLK